MSRIFRAALFISGLTIALLSAAALRAQSIVRWVDLTSAQVAALDRAHTAVIVAGGTIEEHGPLLPNGGELFQNDRIATDLAAEIVSRPGWTVLMLPTVPLGSGAFDRRAGRSGFTGSLAVLASTIQAVFTDLADNLGQQGFRFVFVINGHADANHDRATRTNRSISRSQSDLRCQNDSKSETKKNIVFFGVTYTSIAIKFNGSIWRLGGRARCWRVCGHDQAHY